MAKRRNRRKVRLPVSPRSFGCIILSCIEIGLYALGILFYINGVTQVAKIFGAIGTISVVLTFGAVIISLKDTLNPEYDLISRIVGMALPIVAFVIWAGSYLLGFVSL